MLAHPALRLLLSPLFLAQGLAVRHRASRLPEAEGARAGVVGDGPVLRLLVLGDSSAAGVGVAHQDEALAGQLGRALAADFTVQWQLHARIGATTASTIENLRRIQPSSFDAAVVALGVNDVARQVPLARWRSRQEALTELLRARFGVRRIYLSGVPPMGRFPLLPDPLRTMLGARAEAFDAQLAAHVRGRLYLRHLPFDSSLLDPAMMAEDGFHPGPAIYRHWGETVATAIRADFRPSGSRRSEDTATGK
ncbi:SGNH/GDSL hydrolase family protein [Pararhodobacter sp. SW119]|uniref:SGNH/GDSL hydrolase family protein n=1 Tax=Pararhodobacter sp. SW119 TaxID=2780075 RepID=UPI001AE0E242|nr:SGNH/GDSL hydrolase family protein [Pararhodobacter sp. SW119]